MTPFETYALICNWCNSNFAAITGAETDVVLAKMLSEIDAELPKLTHEEAGELLANAFILVHNIRHDLRREIRADVVGNELGHEGIDDADTGN